MRVRLRRNVCFWRASPARPITRGQQQQQQQQQPQLRQQRQKLQQPEKQEQQHKEWHRWTTPFLNRSTPTQWYVWWRHFIVTGAHVEGIHIWTASFVTLVYLLNILWYIEWISKVSLQLLLLWPVFEPTKSNIRQKQAKSRQIPTNRSTCDRPSSAEIVRIQLKSLPGDTGSTYQSINAI